MLGTLRQKVGAGSSLMVRPTRLSVGFVFCNVRFIFSF